MSPTEETRYNYFRKNLIAISYYKKILIYINKLNTYESSKEAYLFRLHIKYVYI
jgi:hypothetical protein